ncbi:MAG: hypothetical protein JJU26_04195 [Oceanicaulis sp.]|uniref:hypothetical protein n=1 Tax=Glycocaulis sp. TaxID=1969725 RepID=UPI0025BED628|nr:hypothetical protein [Glycocaulis sp.]MCC5980900.1 hypothetical protein [Oceanicaulis sp.]MCH8522539.1 hypothetical protein [Glycocaulis sp.]
MRNAALVDDDPVELVILSGLAESIDQPWTFTRFSSVEDFIDASAATRFDVLFLDRRVPPHSRFEDSVAIVEQSGFEGHVVLLTNHRVGTKRPASKLNVLGPYEKMDIQEPEALEALLGGQAPG